MLNCERIFAVSWFHVGFILVILIENVVGDVGVKDVDSMLGKISRRVIVKVGGEIGSGICGNWVNLFKTSSGGGWYDILKTIDMLNEFLKEKKKNL